MYVRRPVIYHRAMYTRSEQVRRFPIIRFRVSVYRLKIKAGSHCVQVARCSGIVHNGNLSGCQTCAPALPGCHLRNCANDL